MKRRCDAGWHIQVPLIRIRVQKKIEGHRDRCFGYVCVRVCAAHFARQLGEGEQKILVEINPQDIPGRLGNCFNDEICDRGKQRSSSSGKLEALNWCFR
jgi:hypothetical protein